MHSPGTHISLQEVVHTGLCHLLGLLELLHGLAQLLIGDLALPLLLVVEVQAAALQLLQVVLRARTGVRSRAQGLREGLPTAPPARNVAQVGLDGGIPGSPLGPCRTGSAEGR